MTKKTILVTGGAGFIASHIVDAYVALGHKVVVVDNLSTGSRKNLNPKARFYKADIKDLAQMRAIFKKERPQVVSHHAAIAEVVKSMRDPLNTFATNVDGTVNLLLCSGEFKVKKFIFSSTGGAMYGKPEKLPADETTTPTPLSPYGLSKLLGEECIKYYTAFYGFAYTIFRYGNVYGPRQNPHGEAGVVAIFGDLIKSGGRPIIFGDGSKTRDYIFVGDIVEANKKALSKGEGHIMNLGWGKQVSDRNMYDAITKTLHFKGAPLMKPFRPGELQKSALDARRARTVLGWKPKVALREGLARTL
jgi:UDP-glucose 4-epimerase